MIYKDIKYVDIDLIVTNVNQPRRHFDEEALNELALSIKEYGVLQPLIVNELNDNYFLIAGERRYRASKIANIKQVPVVIQNASNEDISRIAIVENVQRENLSAIEEAMAFRHLNSEFKMTQDQIAISIGKTQSTVANKLRLLKLHPTVQSAIMNNQITERHGRCLLALDVSEQEKMLERVIKNNYTVAQLEKTINKPKKTKVKTVRKVSAKEQLAINTLKQTSDLLNRNGIDHTYVVNDEDDEIVVSFTIKR